mgnify:CR=1 FL=1
MTSRPRLIVTEEHLVGLDRTTSESRRRMTVGELIEAMGPLHVNHAQFKARPRSLLPLPNLALPRVEIESGHNVTFTELVVLTWRWMMR